MARNNYQDYNNGSIYTDASEDFSSDINYDAIGKTRTAEHYSDVAAGGYTEPLEEMSLGTELADQLTDTSVAQTVGWLICVKGESKGKDFHLHNGWNYIGRDPKSDVCVNDRKVSGTMARVSYDARNRGFAISTSEGAKNLTYCNNKPVYNTVEINAYDTISMGDTDFIFVPLCGPHFTWEE